MIGRRPLSGSEETKPISLLLRCWWTEAAAHHSLDCTVGSSKNICFYTCRRTCTQTHKFPQTTTLEGGGPFNCYFCLFCDSIIDIWVSRGNGRVTWQHCRQMPPHRPSAFTSIPAGCQPQAPVTLGQGPPFWTGSHAILFPGQLRKARELAALEAALNQSQIKF